MIDKSQNTDINADVYEQVTSPVEGICAGTVGGSGGPGLHVYIGSLGGASLQRYHVRQDWNEYGIKPHGWPGKEHSRLR